MDTDIRDDIEFQAIVDQLAPATCDEYTAGRGRDYRLCGAELSPQGACPRRGAHID